MSGEWAYVKEYFVVRDMLSTIYYMHILLVLDWEVLLESSFPRSSPGGSERSWLPLVGACTPRGLTSWGGRPRATS